MSLTFIQHAAPEEMRGRVVSLQTICWAGPLPLIGLIGGALASMIGLPATLMWFGVLCLVYCVPFMWLARYLPTTSIAAPSAATRLAAQEEEDFVVVPVVDALRSAEDG